MKQIKKLFPLLALLILSLTLILTSCDKTEGKEAATTTLQNLLKVTFNSHGGSEIPSQEIEKGYKIRKPNDPTREGYQFTGWTYAGEEWSFLDHTVSFDMTLDANWKRINYSITYRLNGGTNSISNPSTYTVESNTITFANPTRSGYTFTGWDITSIPHGSTGNVVVTAHWSEPIVYTITYNLNGGTNAASNPKSYTVNSSNITLANPTRTGYTFDGWYESGNSKITTIKTSSVKNFNLYAKWTINTYKITYSNTNGDGAYALNSSAVQTVTYGSKYTLVPAQKRIGNTFLGWYNGETLFQSGSWNRLSDVSLTAKWQEDPALAPFIYTSTATTCEITGVKDKTVTTLVVPDYVTSIRAGAFSGCSSLKSITIPNSVTSIGDEVFYNCTGLTSVTIPESVTSIGEDAFSGCSSLTSITIPNSVTSIGWHAFRGCTGLTSITIPFVGATKNGTTDTNFRYIFGYSSDVPTSLKTVVITGGTSIGEDAFYNCSSLTSITIPESVTSIGRSAFFGCSRLKSITIPDSVTNIEGFAFSGCSKLQYNEYDNGYYLGNASNPYVVLVKAKDTSITSCTIHEKTKFIYYQAFYDCSRLTSITIPDSVTSIGEDAFRNCSRLTSITIGNSVTSIGDYAFYNCSSLTSITIPNSVTSIGVYAFISCTGLTSITIPDSVTSIGGGAFSDCFALKSITYQGTEAQWNKISKGSSWDGWTGEYTIHCTDGDISK